MKSILYKIRRLGGFGKCGGNPFLKGKIEQIFYLELYFRRGILSVRR